MTCRQVRVLTVKMGKELFIVFGETVEIFFRILDTKVLCINVNYDKTSRLKIYLMKARIK